MKTHWILSKKGGSWWPCCLGLSPTTALTHWWLYHCGAGLEACSLAVKGTDLIWSRGQKAHAGKGLQLSQPEAEVPAVVTDSGGNRQKFIGRAWKWDSHWGERWPLHTPHIQWTLKGASTEQTQCSPESCLSFECNRNTNPVQRVEALWAQGVWPWPLTKTWLTNYTDTGVTSSKSGRKSR